MQGSVCVTNNALDLSLMNNSPRTKNAIIRGVTAGSKGNQPPVEPALVVWIHMEHFTRKGYSCYFVGEWLHGAKKQFNDPELCEI